ncbi:MAG: hypothetical protein HWD86_04465 [Kangiellaceae bacterium]|nr:hypothetical protein [Kangiellaceae bacterium]
MKVFVIETHLLGGEQDHGVFECQENAQKYIEQNDSLHGSPEVLQLTVIGHIEQIGVVYAASSYDAEQDLLFFESVYGNRDDAQQAAGANGLVLRRKIIKKSDF